MENRLRPRPFGISTLGAQEPQSLGHDVIDYSLIPPSAPSKLHLGSAAWTLKKVVDWVGAIQNPDQNHRERN